MLITSINYYPFGMLMPGRIFSDEGYRFGYQSSEKDDEVSGNGNSYSTHFRQYDPRLVRWKSMDPKVTAYESPYLSMGGNPILYNDILGDTIEVAGSSGEVDHIISAINKGFNSNVNFNYIQDNEGNTVGAKIFGETNSQGDVRYNDLRDFLFVAMNADQTIELYFLENNPGVDPIERRGGAWYGDRSSTIEFTDQYYTGNWKGSGKERPHYLQYTVGGGWFTDAETLKASIPFSEVVAHELLHFVGDIMGTSLGYGAEEENRVKKHMNKWRESMGFPKREIQVRAKWMDKITGNHGWIMTPFNYSIEEYRKLKRNSD
ncbi:MAG: RHS repeat-associated core domain-containing protein [Bacteroidota bacterium]